MRRREKGQKREKRRGDVGWKWGSGLHPHLKHVRSRMAKRNGAQLSRKTIQGLIEQIQSGNALMIEKQSNTRSRVVVNTPDKRHFYFVVYSSANKTLVTSLPLHKSVRRAVHDAYGIVVNQSGRAESDVIAALERGEDLPRLYSIDPGYVLIQHGQWWIKLEEDGQGGYIDAPPLSEADKKKIFVYYHHHLSKRGMIL